MKTIQILLRHRVTPIKARAALRQMCVWVNPADSDYAASYDPLVAKWSAFEKDMADVRSQREGPLRWNPPSYKNEDFLLLQKNQPTKPSTRGIRKQNSRNSNHRQTPHNTVKQDVLDGYTKPNLQKRTPDYGVSIKNKRQEIEEEEQMPQRSSSSVDFPRRRAQVREASFKGTEIEAPERGEISTESAIQESLSKEVPLEDVTVKEVSQKLARPTVLEAQSKIMSQKKSSGPRTSVKTRRQEYEEEDQMPQKVSSSKDMLRRRAPSRETKLRENQSGADAPGKAETLIESVTKEIPSREVPLKEFAVTEDSFEDTESRTPMREAPVKRMLPREVSENVDSSKDVADSEDLAPERPDKGQDHSAKGISRGTSTFVPPAHEELNERDLAQEIAMKIAPLREVPKKRTISRERLEANERSNAKKTSLSKVPSGEESFKKAPVDYAVHKSVINSMHEVKGSEDRGFQRNENKSANVDSSLEGNSSQQLNNDILTSISNEGTMKESTTFSKKKYEALRKYIAEAEVELRVQKQMLYTQKEDFKRRLRKMALNPLAEIERNSKVHLQHPLDYFNQKSKILRTGMKSQKKVSDEVNINSTPLSKSNESMPVQSQLKESSEAISDNEHYSNVEAVKDEVIAEPNPQSNFTEITPEEHQGKGNKLEGRSRNKAGIQGRSKEMLGTMGNVESIGLPHSIQARKKMLKEDKNRLLANKSNIRHEDSDNIEVGESRQEVIVDLNMSSEKISSFKNNSQTYIRNPSGNVESSALQEISSTVGVVPERVTQFKVTRTRPLSKERYDYFDGNQSLLSSNQLNPQKPVKRKIVVESFSNKSKTVEANQEKTQPKTKLLRVIDSQSAIGHVRSANAVPQPQENDNYYSLESREMQGKPQQEIHRDVGDGELKQQKGTGVATTNQIGRASSILDRSRAKLRKHFMDRSAPIRLNKNAAYIYHPSESTISTLTKTALDTVGDSDIQPIPVLSTYTGSENQATLKQNNVEELSKQEYEHFLTSPSELVYLTEQPSTTKAQKLPESNLTIDQTKDAPSEGWDDAIIPMKINLMPADDSATLITSPQKDNPARQTQNKINVKQESKLSSIPATSEKVRSKYQKDYINKIVYTDAYLSSSKNKRIPEYNYFNTSGVETRPNTKDIPSKSNDKQFPDQNKTRFFSVNELSATGQTTAPEKYDFIPERSELSNITLKTNGSKNRASLLEKLSKTDNAKYKQQVRSGCGSIPLYSNLSNLPNNYQPVSAHSGRINSEYHLSKESINSPETERPEIQIYNQKMSSVADHTITQPQLLHQFNVEQGSKKPRYNPEIEFNTIEKSDSKKQSSRSLEKLYSSLQTTYDSFSSNSVSDSEVNASESNSRGSEAINTLQDIEEGIPSSRVKLRPPLDAFTSFGVGKVASESEPSSSPFPRSQTRSTDTEPIVAASNSLSVRSRSLPSKPFVKVNTPQEGNSAKDARVLTGKSRSRPHSYSQTGTTELSQLRTSRRIRDRYPTLFKHEQNADPFDEIFPFPYEKSDYSPSTYKNLLSNIPVGKSLPVTLQSNSLDYKFKKPSQDNLKTCSTMFNKSKAPVIGEESRLSEEQFGKDRVQQAKTISNEWPDRVTQSKDFIDSSTYGNSGAYHKSYRFDPSTQTQSGLIPSVQDPLDQSTKRYRTKSNLTSRLDRTPHFDSTDAAITFRPGEIETSKKRKPILYKKPDVSKTKFRPRFINPSTYDVENVDSFISVDDSFQLPGSPIRKWKVVPKETGRAVYVASIPQNKTSP